MNHSATRGRQPNLTDAYRAGWWDATNRMLNQLADVLAAPHASQRTLAEWRAALATLEPDDDAPRRIPREWSHPS